MNKKITGGTGFILKGLGWNSKGTGTAPTPHKVTTRTLVGKPETPSPEKVFKPKKKLF